MHMLKKIVVLCVLPLLSAMLLVNSAKAATSEHVKSVQACTGLFLIFLDDGKILFVRDNDVTSTQSQRLFAMALSLMTTGQKITWYNASQTASTACGNTAYEITVLAATSTQ